jgi:hypothetical protein
VTLPKPMTSGATDGRFGKQDFAYLPAEDSVAAQRANCLRSPATALATSA